MIINIRKAEAGNIIKIKPRTRLRTEHSTLTVNNTDAICNSEVLVKKINKTSIQIMFLGEIYRMEFKSNPSVELIQNTQK